MHDLVNYSIVATDGKVGKVIDFLFDDEKWAVRYFVVETGNWLSSRKVLISPIGIQKAGIQEKNWQEKEFPVAITKEQVKNSPEIDTEKPVSRQHEIDFLGYYGYPYYWGSTGIWGESMYPYSFYDGIVQRPEEHQELDGIALEHDKANRKQHQNDDPHLRSSKAIIGYHIHAKDGDIGHVSAVLIEDDSMVVRYLVVDTTNWFGGKKVLISPEWIDDISWLDNSVTINLICEQIKEAPEYQISKELNRDYESELHKHYGLSSYWEIV
tara:strand:+ start:36283 stop:37086 length:804 start_codon:yes stop_codon:yes gene_type:complete